MTAGCEPLQLPQQLAREPHAPSELHTAINTNDPTTTPKVVSMPRILQV
jgi:hypothetical protein